MGSIELLFSENAMVFDVVCVFCRKWIEFLLLYINVLFSAIDEILPVLLPVGTSNLLPNEVFV
jgi:hypothetical protein